VLLGRSRHAVLRAVKRGQLPGLRVGRAWLVDLCEVDGMVRRGTEERAAGRLPARPTDNTKAQENERPGCQAEALDGGGDHGARPTR
jgi:hypothetical protein